MPQVDTIDMRRPHADCLRPCDVSFRTLLQALSVDNLMTAFALVLREQQVIVVSHFQQAYSMVTEALVSLLFPLSWEFPFISVAPVQLINVLDSPVPFVIGLCTKILPPSLPVGVSVVDLDANVVFGAGMRDTPSWTTLLPPSLAKPMHARLMFAANAAKIQCGKGASCTVPPPPPCPLVCLVS